MPEGFNDSCYGGNFSKNLAGANPIYSAQLDIPDSSWPQLKKTLTEVAMRHGAKTFDDSRSDKTLKMFSVYLCSEDGLFSFADKRTWSFPGEAPHGPQSIHVTVFAYRKDQRWHELSKDMDAALRSQWPDKLRTTSPADSRLLNSAL
jgi:hypothetical protein